MPHRSGALHLEQLGFKDAAAEVRRCTGTQFDPEIVEPTLASLSDHLPQTVS
jgi:HD-GYP domain-containing protein (c-di-GMP phosphodiesterase class II)